MLEKLIKKIIHFTWRPVLQFYLNKDRNYSYKGVCIRVKKDVFHPGFFFSTRLLLNKLESEKINGKTVLELGAGTGLISIIAALNGAIVTASDISPEAIANIRLNLSIQQTKKAKPFIQIIHSDLFQNIPGQIFDYIVINPPYYPKEPLTMAEKAWFCGLEFEYFENLFSEIKNYMQPHTQVWISLSQDCQIDVISKIANKHNCSLLKLVEKKTGWERHYIFQTLLKDM